VREDGAASLPGQAANRQEPVAPFDEDRLDGRPSKAMGHQSLWLDFETGTRGSGGDLLVDSHRTL
jgi:hypothetical protein